MALIDVHRLKKSFQQGPTKQLILDGFSLSIEEGSFIGLHGRSGSGKTTLLQILGCIDTFEDGSYSFAGRKIEDMDEKSREHLRRAEIGFIFQTFNLISTLTVFENVEYPLLLLGWPVQERKIRVEQMLRQVDMAGFGGSFPDRLSGGQRQRVAIARALVKKPRLIIADEPTANLDGHNSDAIAEILISLQKQLKVTVICSSHDPAFLLHADQKFSIHDGVRSL